MAKVTSFRAETTKLSSDFGNIKHVSEYWVVQFVGAPGIMIGGKERTNVHYICPYRKFPFGWAVDPYTAKLLVKEFDFEKGLVMADDGFGFGNDIIFSVVEFKK